MNTFPKNERLSSKKIIQELFKKGSSFYFYPFKVFYTPASVGESPVDQVLFSIPRRNFKKAVDRNLIRRRLKESYRLNKSIIAQNENSLHFFVAFVYIAKQVMSYEEINSKLKEALLRLHPIKK